MRPIRFALPLALTALALVLAACNSAAEDSTASPSPTPSDNSLASEVTASPTAEATLAEDSLADAVTETPAPDTLATAAPTAEATPEACAPTTDGAPSGGATPVTVNNDCLDPLFFAFDANSGDPFWHIHTQQDDTFISLELYTVYGPSWAGETGVFPLDCNQPWGLCLIFDPDGTGPAPVIMWGTGEITIDRIDAGGYDVTFTGVMPAATDGTIYDFTSTTWTGS